MRVTIDLAAGGIDARLHGLFYEAAGRAREQAAHLRSMVWSYERQLVEPRAQAAEIGRQAAALEARAAAFAKTGKSSLTDRERSEQLAAEALLVRDREREANALIALTEVKQTRASERADWLDRFAALASHSLFLDPATAPEGFDPVRALNSADLDRLARAAGLLHTPETDQ